MATQAVEIGEHYKGEVKRRERAEAEVSRLKEVEAKLGGKLQQKEDLLEERDNFLFQKNNMLLKQGEEISHLQGGVLRLREQLSQAQAEAHNLKEDLSLTALQAVEDFRRSEEFAEELVSAYAACWDEAAKLCTEQGLPAVAALMAERREALGAYSEDDEEDPDAGVAKGKVSVGGSEAVTSPTGVQGDPPVGSSSEIPPPDNEETPAGEAPPPVV